MGTAAADEFGPDRKLVELFEKTGKVPAGEVLIAVEFYAEEEFFFVAGYFHPKSNTLPSGWIPSLREDFDNSSGPISVRRVEVKLTLTGFFKIFKRFNVMLLRKDLSITDREYDLKEN